MSILGPVAVYLNSGGSVLQQEENADKEVLVLKCIVEEATGCMIVGLHLTDFHTKVAANLMDLGLRVAIFDISGVSSHHAKDILSTFPRTRVGLVLPHDPVAAEATIRQYRDVGKGIYWSRSRGSLWRKGDTSGHHQKLIEMRYDCDRDALRFTVIQTGQPPAFCHLMTRTCWGQEQGLQKLESLLKERRLSAPEGSYTKRLFDDPQLLKKKLLEEVQELVEAEEPDHVAAEAADVIYFMMTRCVAAGVGLREIEKHLDRRSLKLKTKNVDYSKTWKCEGLENQGG
eukprot:gene30071-39265_t